MALSSYQLVVASLDLSEASLLFCVDLESSVEQTLRRRREGAWPKNLAYLEGTVEARLSPHDPTQHVLVSGGEAPPLHILLSSFEKIAMNPQELPLGVGRGGASARISELWKVLDSPNHVEEQRPELAALQRCILVESARNRIGFYLCGAEHFLEIAIEAAPPVVESIRPDEFVDALRDAHRRLSDRVLAGASS